MKEKIITIKVDGALQGQWSSLLLELNLMKQAWKSYGVDITMKAPGLKNVLNHGTKVNDDTKKIDEAANKYNKTKDPKYKDLWYKLVKEKTKMDLIL
jgi:hypothetical protein